jgi:glycolate oxidase FAD binding subunit
VPPVAETLTPSSPAELAAALAGAAAAARPVRIAGAGTKLGWGSSPFRDALRLSTAGLQRMLAHNPADLTATFEAGAPLAAVQAQLASAGQMLALDPPGALDGRSPTLGGIFATADCGPLRHRYGPPRDLILGMRVALCDGTIAGAGAAVVRNAAGYDLPRLFTGSMGSLGVILSVTVRLHPLIGPTVTVVGSADGVVPLAAATAALNRSAFELEALDFAWRRGRGGVLARCAGADANERARPVAELMAAAGLTEVAVREADEQLWSRQRAGQRSSDRAIVRVVAPRSALAVVLRLADACEATVVGRAAAGISYLTVNVNRIATVRAGLPAGATAIVRDIPVAARGAVELWGPLGERERALMRAVKREFDPGGICNPGALAGCL